MWNIGNMHTATPRGSSWAPGCERSTLARWESTTPLGTPVDPLVKNTTWGSVSRRSGVGAGEGSGPASPASVGGAPAADG